MQDKIREFVRIYGLETDLPSRYIDFSAEAGQLGKQILFCTDYGNRPLEASEELCDQAGDTLFALLALLNDLNISEKEILEKTMARYEARMKQLLNEKE